MMNILYSCRYTSVFVLAYVMLSYLVQIGLLNRMNASISSLGNASILVIAHPDDETMFFGPTILNLIDNDHRLLILCLSSSTTTQLSMRRRQELMNVSRSLGESVKVAFADEPTLPDDMNENWNTSTILDHIQKQVSLHDLPTIHTMITFDSYGISGHPNHQAIFKTVELFKSTLNMRVFVLKSVSLARKYTFFLDSIPTVIIEYFWNKKPPSYTVALDFSNYLRLKKMLELHKSQMVWFRQLYKAFSRYMFINDLVEYF